MKTRFKSLLRFLIVAPLCLGALRATDNNDVLLHQWNSSTNRWDNPVFHATAGRVIGFDGSGNLALITPTVSSLAWSAITGTPTTLAGYGIADTLTTTQLAAAYQPLSSNLTSWAAIAPSAKQNALTLGNLAETTSGVLTITGGTGAIVGSGLTIQVKQSSSSQAGYLSSADWSTFNGKLAANGSGASLTALNATELTSGTVPDARFPATLPALDGSALTALNATELTSGTVPDDRFPDTLPALDGSALTALNASSISTGTLDIARVANASVTEAKLAFVDNTTGDATTSAHGFMPKFPGGTTNFLRADGTFAAPSGGGGASALSDLTDVAISGLADGDMLLFDSGSGFWFNTPLQGDMLKSTYDPLNAGKISGGATGSGGGGVLSMVGANGNAGSINTDASGNKNGGGINTSSAGSGNGGSISTQSNAAGGEGGSINTSSGTAQSADGGSINTSSGGHSFVVGGSIDTHADAEAGGSISTYEGGGSINTRGTGSIQLGSAGTRTTITGSASADRALNLPDFDSFTVGFDSGWASNASAGDKTVAIPDYSHGVFGDLDGGTFGVTYPEMLSAINTLADQVVALTKKLQAIEAALAAQKLPNN